MAERVYYKGRTLTVTSGRLTHEGTTYPVSGIAAVRLTRNASAGCLALVLLAAVSAFIFGLVQAVTGFGGGSVSNGLWGLGLMVGGVFGILFLRWLSSQEEHSGTVYVSLASGAEISVETDLSTAEAIHDAVAAALADRETARSSGYSVAEELSQLAALRDAGVIESDDWERAKDLFLGKVVLPQFRGQFSIRPPGPCLS